MRGDPLALGADVQNLGQHLRQRHEAADRARGGRRRVIVPVGQVVHAVHDADRQRLAAGRAASAQALGLLRQQAQIATPVAVEMVFTLFGEEFDRAQIAPPGLQRRPYGEVIEVGVEDAGFAPQLFGRVRVGVGHQPEAIQRRDAPVHLRVGRQAGLDREDVRGEVGVALVDGVEPGLRAERGEPRRPDVGRHEIRTGVRLQRDLQQMPGVQTEDGPAVGPDVADGRQLVGDAAGRLEVRRVEQVMNFAGLVALFVDGRDFHRQQEARRPLTRGRQHGRDFLFQVGAQAEEARLRGHQLLPQFGGPRRMREVARSDDGDPFLPRPIGEVFQVAVLAGRARIPGVDVQVGVEGHGRVFGRRAPDLPRPVSRPRRGPSWLGNAPRVSTPRTR